MQTNPSRHIKIGTDETGTSPAANAAASGCSNPKNVISKVDKKTADPQNRIV